MLGALPHNRHLPHALCQTSNLHFANIFPRGRQVHALCVRQLLCARPMASMLQTFPKGRQVHEPRVGQVCHDANIGQGQGPQTSTG